MAFETVLGNDFISIKYSLQQIMRNSLAAAVQV